MERFYQPFFHLLLNQIRSPLTAFPTKPLLSVRSRIRDEHVTISALLQSSNILFMISTWPLKNPVLNPMISLSERRLLWNKLPRIRLPGQYGCYFRRVCLESCLCSLKRGSYIYLDFGNFNKLC